MILCSKMFLTIPVCECLWTQSNIIIWLGLILKRCVWAAKNWRRRVVASRFFSIFFGKGRVDGNLLLTRSFTISIKWYSQQLISKVKFFRWRKFMLSLASIFQIRRVPVAWHLSHTSWSRSFVMNLGFILSPSLNQFYRNLSLQKVMIHPVLLDKIVPFVQQRPQIRLICQLKYIGSLVFIYLEAFENELFEKRIYISSPPTIGNRTIYVVLEVVLSLAELKGRISVQHLVNCDA